MSRRPAAEKLPLAQRKNVRDEWEVKKPEFEKKLSEELGAPWTIDINPNAIWVYGEPDSWPNRSPGGCIADYVSSAIGRLDYFKNREDPGAYDEINAICHAHVLTMDVDLEKRFNYCGAGVTPDGKLAILFHEAKLGTNSNDAFDPKVLLEALNRAPPPADSTSKLSYAARAGIRREWDPKFEEERSKIAKLLEREDISFEPNWDEVYATLQKEKSRKGNSLEDNWDSRIGMIMFSYFEGVASHIKDKKFGDDDMLREGFNEVVDKGVIAFRIVDKLAYDNYCEVVVEDGKLYIQTLAEKWGSNAWYAAQKIVDQL